MARAVTGQSAMKRESADIVEVGVGVAGLGAARMLKRGIAWAAGF